jgi:hypothetical protein
MNTAENIRRLELVLASPFWGGDARQCIMEKMTLKVMGHDGAYCWRLDDADDGSYAKDDGPFPSVAAAKDSLRYVLEDGLRKQRGSASTY